MVLADVRAATILLAFLLAAGTSSCRGKKAIPPAESVPVETPATALDPAAGAAGAAAAATEGFARMARGAYVAAIAGCEGCHTPLDGRGRADRERLLAGGLEVADFTGPWRSPNITPDPKSGIGAWSDADLRAAVRQGVAPGGRRLDVWMPSHHLRVISDDDLAALISYLRGMRPISATVLGLASKRPARALVPPPFAPVPPPGPDAVERGRYLAELGACASCHAPAEARSGAEMGTSLSGGRKMIVPSQSGGPGHVFASNITPDVETGIGRISDHELAGMLTRGIRADGRPLLHPMDMVARGWVRATTEDVQAVIAFLRAQRPVRNRVPAATVRPPEPVVAPSLIPPTPTVSAETATEPAPPSGSRPAPDGGHPIRGHAGDLDPLRGARRGRGGPHGALPGPAIDM